VAAKLAKLEHLLSRNSGNSSSPPSKDDGLGRTPPPEKSTPGEGGPKRRKGKQPGASGANLAWAENPDARRDRFPEGRCACGHDLGQALDLGIVDRYQQHEIPRSASRSRNMTSMRCAAAAAGCMLPPVRRVPGLELWSTALI
jgi:transposase